jgi:hypothetical protein
MDLAVRVGGPLLTPVGRRARDHVEVHTRTGIPCRRDTEIVGSRDLDVPEVRGIGGEAHVLGRARVVLAGVHVHLVAFFHRGADDVGAVVLTVPIFVERRDEDDRARVVGHDDARVHDARVDSARVHRARVLGERGRRSGGGAEETSAAGTQSTWSISGSAENGSSNARLSTNSSRS